MVATYNWCEWETLPTSLRRPNGCQVEVFMLRLQFEDLVCFKKGWWMDDISWFKSTLMHNIRILTSECLWSFNSIANWSHLLVLTVKAIVVFHAVPVYLPYKFKVVAIYFKTLFNHRNPLKVYVPIVGTFFVVLLSRYIFMQMVSSNPQMSIRKNVISKKTTNGFHRQYLWMIKLGIPWFVFVEGPLSFFTATHVRLLNNIYSKINMQFKQHISVSEQVVVICDRFQPLRFLY